MICFCPGMCYPYLWERSCFVEDYECEGIMCVSHCSRVQGWCFCYILVYVLWQLHKNVQTSC